MKWFQHDTNARQDFKIKRLTKRFGMEGYGVYWSVIELLAFETKDSLDFSLSLDSYPLEDIAHDLDVEVTRLSEIMDFMASVGLVDTEAYSRKVLCCNALSKRADEYTRGQQSKIRKLGTRSALGTDSVALQYNTVQDNTTQDNTSIGHHRAQIQELWNSVGLPRILNWSHIRLEHLRCRLKDQTFVSQYKEAISRLAKSDFALGRGKPRHPGEKPWTVSIDWFLENDNNYVKVLEGKYDNRCDKFDKYYSTAKR